MNIIGYNIGYRLGSSLISICKDGTWLLLAFRRLD
jgi:hypothetical protein